MKGPRIRPPYPACRKLAQLAALAPSQPRTTRGRRLVRLFASWLVGVISDTHGLLRGEACSALAGSAVIVHAGDIGSKEILDRLRAVAPVRAVRGNMDRGTWARKLPNSDKVELEGCALWVLHDLEQLHVNPEVLGASVVVIPTARTSIASAACCTSI